jgi:hypothetical protein
VASTDWSDLGGGLDSNSVDRGVTNGVARPNGGGDFCFAYNSLVDTDGACGKYCTVSDFNPTAKGISIRGAMQRAVGQSGYAPMLLGCLSDALVTGTGYLLGLSDAEPHHIVLVKGRPIDGLPDASPGTSGVLKRSTATYSAGVWHHLRLDVIVNLNGDVLLQAFRNDLAAHTVSSPGWEAIAGLDEFIDDCAQINSGSTALLAGRAGFAFQSSEIGRRAYFDHLVLERQTTP